MNSKDEASTVVHQQRETLPVDPRRLRSFVSFFKGYIALSTYVVAALPIAATSLGAIETFAHDRKMLGVFTSLYCFLTLAFIFYQRHALGRWMYSEFTVKNTSDANKYWKRAAMWVLPLIFMLLSAACCWFYFDVLSSSVSELMTRCGVSREEVLDRSQPSSYPANTTRALYIGMFVFAEAAFVLMATKEYMQDVLRLGDVEIMAGKRDSAT